MAASSSANWLSPSKSSLTFCHRSCGASQSATVLIRLDNDCLAITAPLPAMQQPYHDWPRLSVQCNSSSSCPSAAVPNLSTHGAHIPAGMPSVKYLQSESLLYPWP